MALVASSMDLCAFGTLNQMARLQAPSRLRGCGGQFAEL